MPPRKPRFWVNQAGKLNTKIFAFLSFKIGKLSVNMEWVNFKISKSSIAFSEKENKMQQWGLLGDFLVFIML